MEIVQTILERLKGGQNIGLSAQIMQKVADMTEAAFFGPFFEDGAVCRVQAYQLGVHGNGLSHLMWMPRGSSVVELFYPE